MNMAMPNLASVQSLWDDDEGIFYFRKDQDGRYVAASAWLQRRLFRNTEKAILGKTDFDLLNPLLALQWQQDDRCVLEHGRVLRHRLALLEDCDKKIAWCLISRAPVRDHNGIIIGIEGLGKDVALLAPSWHPYQTFAQVIAHIHAHMCREISIVELARIAGMSVTTFERHFQRQFGCPPKVFITHQRIQEACCRLRAQQPIKRVAQELGFCDQSHFTKAFKQCLHTTPGEFQHRGHQFVV